MFLNLPPIHNLVIPFLGALLVCAIGGLLSPILVLKQRSYLSDTLAHLIFPGVVIGLLVSRIWHLEIWICMMCGAFVTALLGTYLSEWLLLKLKIPPDSAAIVSLSTFFAFGILLIEWTKQEAINPETLLFGDVFSLQMSNIFVLLAVVIGLSSVIFMYRNHWNAWLTDPEFAQITGFKIKLLDKLFPVLITVSVLAGFFAVGGLMIAALMTIPAIFCQPRGAFSIPTLLFSFILGVCGFVLAVLSGLSVGPVLVLSGFIAIVVKAICRH